jgi:hypothetical protein
MEILFALEESALGMYVSSTIWGYPIVLSLHAVGMATMVGISLMLTARVLGFAKNIPVTAFLPFWRIAVAGFIINLLSGTALFLGNASGLFFNWAFRIKIILVIIGLLLTWRLVQTCIKGTGIISTKHRQLAGVTILTWISALIIGRLIGYIS